MKINPYQLHINDPEFYDDIYVSSVKRKTDKWYWTVSENYSVNFSKPVSGIAFHVRSINSIDADLAFEAEICLRC